MPFLFLKYLQPTHYFRLHTKTGLTIFPKVDGLTKDILINLKRDENYQSELAKDYDLSWQAVQRGYVAISEVYTDFENLSIRDNYQFIRKNFHKAWVFYVLVLRVLSLHNPIEECSAFFKTRRIKREYIREDYFEYRDREYNTFHSLLLQSRPLISVIIPTLNRYNYLKDVLTDLENQV